MFDLEVETLDKDCIDGVQYRLYESTDHDTGLQNWIVEIIEEEQECINFNTKEAAWEYYLGLTSA